MYRFPAFPTLEEGGSLAIHNPTPPTPVSPEDTNRKGTANGKKKPSTSMSTSRRGKKEEEKLPPVETPPSKFLPNAQKT